jgi:hypothetical protein
MLAQSALDVYALKTNIGKTHAKATSAEAKLSSMAEIAARTLEHGRGWGCDLSFGLCACFASNALIVGRRRDRSINTFTRSDVPQFARLVFLTQHSRMLL